MCSPAQACRASLGIGLPLRSTGFAVDLVNYINFASEKGCDQWHRCHAGRGDDQVSGGVGLASIRFSPQTYLGGSMLLRSRRPPPAGFNEPCLPSPAERPPTGPGWIHEIKHDGLSPDGATRSGWHPSAHPQRL
jgi:hypothetical protein